MIIKRAAKQPFLFDSPEALAEVKIGESMVRMSVGLEDWQDIVADLESCLKKV